MNSSRTKPVAAWALGFALGAALWTNALAFTPSQQPPDSSSIPGNVLLALSVEFPTGLQVSYTATTYTVLTKYEGYFDNTKCYTYSTANEVFDPTGAMNTTTGACPVSTEWSGNLLNWLTMTNVDQFRSVMTGGTRDSFSSKAATYHGDTTARTVLIRSFSDRNAYNPNKTLTVGTPGMPLTGTHRIARSAGYGSKLIVTNTGNSFTTWDLAGAQPPADLSKHYATCAATSPLPTSSTTGSACFNIRVAVCVPAQGLEANCKNKYSGVPKPEGLVQDYANTLRYGAFGYLNENGTNRNGGVLRAAMKSVGAMAATATAPIPNAAKEWDVTTGVMFDNPDSADATASGVTNSGLMNYLNRFGFAQGYKGNDPVSELYYAAQLYMRGRALPTNYTDISALSAAAQTKAKDNFPIVTSNLLRGQSRDPIINTCQKNFILGIGDIYVWGDGNLPGSTRPLYAGSGGLPTDPDGLNVQTLWSNVFNYEFGASGDNSWVGGADRTSNRPTPYMAGLAHWANTNDIRSDLDTKQTIRTYWVDVLENTNGAASVAAASLVKSQYWLAAKYGGFDTSMVTGDNPNTVPTSWDALNPTVGNGIPDTWFAGSTPTLMKTGLSNAFKNIAASVATSSSSSAVTSNRQTDSSQILYAGYNPKGWVGNVRSCSPSQTALQCKDTPTWEASEWFRIPKTAAYVDTPLTPATRKIFTSWKGASFTKMPFQWASLDTTPTTGQQAILNAGDSQGPARVNYLRGDRTNEASLFRAREATLLGDVVNAGVSFISGAGPVLAGSNFPGHSTYRDTKKTAGSAPRPPVAYVGGNDGMLHAFSARSGASDTDKGKELFAYIPGAVYSNLPGLTSPIFQHKYFVDSTPMIGDLQTNPAVPTTWGTFLVGGLGGGGKGYYALDITNQHTFAAATESALSALPKWEFTSADDSDLGYTFNEPAVDSLTGAYKQIAKVADSAVGSTGQWRVIVGNGFGSTAGQAALLMLDANTGTVSNKLVASAGPNNGLATPFPFDSDGDGLVDTVYAGDLLGNVHKFQFSKPSGSDFVIARSGVAGGAWRYLGVLYASGEPITTAPAVTRACDGNGWIVAFGSGKLNEDADYTDTADRRFYAITDKGPSSALTVLSTNLASITPVTSGSTRSWATPDLTGKRGWKMNFTGGERVLSNSSFPPDTGVVLFGTTKPNGDACTPENSGFIMAVNLCSGATGDLIVGGAVVGGTSVTSTGVVKISGTVSAPEEKIVCNQDACKGDPPKLPPKGVPKGRYSWRELFSK